MAVFEYVAMDAGGREKKGVIEGDNARHVRSLLREQQLYPVSVREGTEKMDDSRSGELKFRGRIKGAELALLTRQIATLSGAGTPLAETLQTVAQQSEKNKHRKLVLAVRSRLMEGYSLAESLGVYPQVFPELYRATVAAGEQSGKLDAVLEQLADFTESRQEMQGTVQKALVYPAFLVLVCIAIVAFLLTYAVPQVVGVFANQGRELPGITQTLLNFSDFVSEYGLVLLAALIATVAIFRLLLRNDGFRYRLHAFLLRIPLFGRVIRTANATRFSRTLAILASSGVPLLQAISVSTQVVHNMPMRRAVEHAANRVREGASLSKALMNSGLFPPMLNHMIASGEASGTLAEMLNRGARQQDRELDAMLSAMTSLLGPIITVIMGVVVLTIVVAMILPIMQINTFA